MPRPRKPARLWQRDDGAWIILDNGRQHRTGYCGESGRRSADDALRDYLVTRAPERSGPAQPSEITVGEVLALYVRDRGQQIAGKETLAYAVKALAPFWASRTCDAVKGSTCRAWARERDKANSTTRRHLGVLQAALNYAHAEGVLVYAPKVTLPPNGSPRDRWLTRDEVARLLRVSAPHFQRFILISIVTGRRASAVLGLRWMPSLTNGWVDLDAGVTHFRGAAEQETNKRRGSVSMTRGLAAHMRRWSRSGGSHVVMWRTAGKQGWEDGPIAEIDTAFAAACRRAGLEDVSPHCLKHTAVTWFFQRGGSREDAADWFDTSARTLERVYRSHSPEHQSRAKAIMERRSPA